MSMKINMNEEDIYFMKQALKEARIAYDKKEVPIGAIIVKDNKIISTGHNLRETTKDPTAHAEVLAIRKAAKKIGDWRLEDAILYVTVEPCIMCAGAIILSRIREVVFATRDPKMGAVVSKTRIFDIKGLNHKVMYREGILKEESQALLKKFFRELRMEKWPSLAEGARLEIE